MNEPDDNDNVTIPKWFLSFLISALVSVIVSVVVTLMWWHSYLFSY